MVSDHNHHIGPISLVILLQGGSSIDEKALQPPDIHPTLLNETPEYSGPCGNISRLAELPTHRTPWQGSVFQILELSAAVPFVEPVLKVSK